jgi:hypothetical protein
MTLMIHNFDILEKFSNFRKKWGKSGSNLEQVSKYQQMDGE